MEKFNSMFTTRIKVFLVSLCFLSTGCINFCHSQSISIRPILNSTVQKTTFNNIVSDSVRLEDNTQVKVRGNFGLGVDFLLNNNNKVLLSTVYKVLSRSYRSSNTREYCCIYKGYASTEKIFSPQIVYGRKIFRLDEFSTWINLGIQVDIIRRKKVGNLPDSYTDYYGFEDVARVIKEVNEYNKYSRSLGVISIEGYYKRLGSSFSVGKNLFERTYLRPQISGREVFLNGSVIEYNLSLFYNLRLQ